MKTFNTTTVCIPSKHYMVDLSDKVSAIKKMVDHGKYFTINRARQYGKTTTLRALRQVLLNDYTVISLSFEGVTQTNFSTEQAFVKAFCRLLQNNLLLYHTIPEKIQEQFEDYIRRKEEPAAMDELFITMRTWCAISVKPIVLIIDEVDAATNNQVFLDFLGLLRDGYIRREADEIPSFHSVILAGVTDIRYLKNKIREDSGSKENSPWNVAADFRIDMSLSEDGIRKMLLDYESDHQTGMDTEAIAKKIRQYTNGYPFLVSRICQILDEQLIPDPFFSPSAAWTDVGVEAAVKTIVMEKNTLFDSLIGKLRSYDNLRRQLQGILLRGETVEYLPDNTEQEQLVMYGFIVNDHNTVAVANRIFEMRLYKYFIGESRFAGELRGMRWITRQHLSGTACWIFL